MAPKLRLIVLVVLGFLVIMVAGVFVIKKQNRNYISTNQSGVTTTSTTQNGRRNPWDEKCHYSEEGRKELTKSPLDLESIDVINPMGMMIGGHVTPIDHMYFYPVSTPGNDFAHKVYAMADGYITQVEERGNERLSIRVTIEQTCNQGYYYDLITKLEPSINKGSEIKAGQLVGYVGNQSLDFGVYDTKVTLSFVNPMRYAEDEPWKIHTADAFSYFEPTMLKSLDAKIARKVEPRSGKIDYDKDGYIAGNWFEKGTKGYFGGTHGTPGYWKTHLALAYDAIDPTKIIISIGFLVDESKGTGQYAVIGNTPDPATVNQASGKVKYELTPQNGGQTMGTALMQLTGNQELKLEYFAGKSASEVTGFTSAAKIYER